MTNNILSPNDILNHWLDEEARIKDEIALIMDLLKKRKANSPYPAHASDNGFSFQLASGADLVFMQKVANALRTKGWEAEITSSHGISGSYHIFHLSSPVLSKLPQPTARSMRDNDCGW
jgi:hypothetical protein